MPQPLRLIPICAVGALLGRDDVTMYRWAKQGRWGKIYRIDRAASIALAKVENIIGRSVSDEEIIRAVEAYRTRSRNEARTRMQRVRYGAERKPKVPLLTLQIPARP